jgi:hypothetical protein
MLLLLDRGELVGTVVHARWHEGAERLRRNTRLILAFAVSLHCQGKELSSGQRASDAILAATFADMLERDDRPLAVAGRVHEMNAPSRAVLGRHGFRVAPDPYVAEHLLAVRVLT